MGRLWARCPSAREGGEEGSSSDAGLHSGEEGQAKALSSVAATQDPTGGP